MSARHIVACAVAVIAGASPASASGQLARLRGRVYDSVTALPLVGARVELVNADDRARIVFSTMSDSLGRFVVDSVAHGRYIAGFLHPMLDSLGLSLAQRQLTVNQGDMQVDFAVPSPQRIETALCGHDSEKDSTGVVLGYVLNAHSLTTIAGAAVFAEWSEITLGAAGVSRRSLNRTSLADAEGWFAVCGVPAAASVIVRAVSGTDTSGAIEIEVPKTRIARRNIYVDHAVAKDSTAVAARDSAPRGVTNDSIAPAATPRSTEPVSVHRATVNGWVRTEDGIPVSGARVHLFGSDVTAETNNEGAFEIVGVPGGTQTLMTRAIGFVPDERAIDLTDQHIAIIVGLLSVRRFLDTVHVRADRSTFMTAVGFDERKHGGVGHFFTPKDVERLHPQELSDLLRHAPSIELSTDNAHTVKIRMRGDQGACTPAIFLDGKQLVYFDLTDMNSLVQPEELAGMEVYSAAMTPAQFRTKLGCGTILVWTKPAERIHAKR
jgi:Carboxypeptidase regulatory-like domain